MPKVRKRKWKDDFYVEAYRLARAGQSNRKIAETLGLSEATFNRQLKDKPSLQKALADARGDDSTFQEYVYNRLPRHLRQLWDDMGQTNSVVKLEQMLEGAGVRARQRLFVHALIHSNFNASDACRRVNITRRTLDNWKKYDPEFLELVDEIDWHKANFFEGALIALVKEGHPGAVVFANKTINANRGYRDKSESPNHLHLHQHAVVSVDDLKLPIEARRAILQAIEAQKVNVIDAPQLEGHTDEVQ